MNVLDGLIGRRYRNGDSRHLCPSNKRPVDLVTRPKMDDEAEAFVHYGREFSRELLDHAGEDGGIDSPVRPRVVPFHTCVEARIEDNRNDVGFPSMPYLRPKATLR